MSLPSYAVAPVFAGSSPPNLSFLHSDTGKYTQTICIASRGLDGACCCGRAVMGVIVGRSQRPLPSAGLTRWESPTRRSRATHIANTHMWSEHKGDVSIINAVGTHAFHHAL